MTQALEGKDDNPNQCDQRDIAAALNGDSESYRRLVLRYQPEIAQQMLRFSRNAGVREELVHDVFVEAYLSLPGYKGKSPWLHWLRTSNSRLQKKDAP